MAKENKSAEREGIVFPYPKEGFFDEGLPKGVLSPSGFGMYLRCARQFEYAYVQGIRKAPAIAMLKGTCIHHAVELTHKHTMKHGTPLNIEAATQALSDSFDAEEDQIEDATKEEKGQVKDAAIKGLHVYHRDAVPLITPVAAEKPFAIKVGTVPFRGVIDLIDKVPGEYSLEDDPDQPPPKVEVVSDLKTTKRMWIPQMLAQNAQMTFYAIAENTNLVRVDFVLDQKSGIKYVAKRTTRDRNMKRLLVEDAEEVSHLIKQGVFPRCSPTEWNCSERFCGFYKECRGPK